MLILPEFPPKQPTLLVLATVASKRAGGWLMVFVFVCTHPFASFMVSVYVPVGSPLMFDVVAPVLQT